MYKMLLCSRYLRTRYIALASIISVMLGVATMIVVNSVMAGFRVEMHDRLKGVLSDIVIESHSLNGFSHVDKVKQGIREVLGDDVEGVTAIARVPAALHIQFRGEWLPRQIMLIGIDDATYASVSDFSQYLKHPKNREQLSFMLRDHGYELRENGSEVGIDWEKMKKEESVRRGGWPYRRGQIAYEQELRKLREESERQLEALKQRQKLSAGPQPAPYTAATPVRLASAEEQIEESTTDVPSLPIPAAGTTTDANEPIRPPRWDAWASENPDEARNLTPASRKESPATTVGSMIAKQPPAAPVTDEGIIEQNPFGPVVEENIYDPMKKQSAGIILGIGLVNIKTRDKNGAVRENYLCRPGDDVRIMVPTAGDNIRPVNDLFTVVDIYESKMNEYDSNFAFVPLSRLQELRGMIDPQSGERYVTAIQIKLREGADLKEAQAKLMAKFPTYEHGLRIQTWRELQGPLLAAVQLETTVLNILLFMIIAVAGFGILATFFMIVVEKTRDIGVLKSLGAPGTGVMSIFLGYGMLLGIVGSGMGAVIGIVFVWNINTIKVWVERASGAEVFDPTIYYFQEIPTIIDPFTVMWIVGGAMLIATLASVLPAIRAACMHPVEALRYE